MHPPRDPEFWHTVETALVAALRPLLPGARKSLRVAFKIQDGKVVSVSFRGTLEFRPGVVDDQPAARIKDLVAALSGRYAIAVPYGQISFRLQGWKLVQVRVTESRRRQRKRKDRDREEKKKN
jgi:hypothetical protein